MPDPQQGISSPVTTDVNEFDHVACPFCGMLCDDLTVRNESGRLHLAKNGCARAKAGFERPIPPAAPQIEGKEVALEAALNEAANRIRSARLPLFGGLGSDVEGLRALMALADKAGGVVDHALSAALYKSVGVLQTKGWFMSTLTETRNRADLVIVVGVDLMREHPRFFKRIVSPAETMFGGTTEKRTVVLIGCGEGAAARARGELIADVMEIPCQREDIPVVLGTLRAAIKDVPHVTALPAGVSKEALGDLAQRCRDASYGVMTYAPQTLGFDGGDLAVQAISDIVRDMNKTTRFAGLALGGNDGSASASAVCSWQTGYPLRVSFASGAPDYDPYRYDVARMLAENEGDLLVWISSFGPEPASPPPNKLPLIVFAAPGLEPQRQADVFIPIGTPGLDQTGRMVRCDGVVSLPLRKLRSGLHPPLQEIAAKIEATL